MRTIIADASIGELVKANDGYCPCAVLKNEDTKCQCKEFREQKEPGSAIADCLRRWRTVTANDEGRSYQVV